MTRTMLSPPRLDVAPSLTERCDRCGAAAKLYVTLPTGGDLVFCGHHANNNAESILRQAAHVVILDGFEWQGAAGTSR